MKRCPQCRAEYDDYVQYCFVDGTELRVAHAPSGAGGTAPGGTAPARGAAPPPSPLPTARSTGSSVPPGAPTVPAPPGRTGTTGSGADLRAIAPPDAEPEPSAWTRPITGTLGLFLTALGGIGIVVLAASVLVVWPLIQPQNGLETPPPLAPDDLASSELGSGRGAGVTAPDPNRPPPAAVPVIHMESEPSGAIVYEADKHVCVTPCDVPHPDYAPRSRTFVLQAKGYTPTEHTVTDATQPQVVKLKPVASANPKPAPRPQPAPEILQSR